MLSWMALAGPAWGHIPILYITGPDEDWCGVINGTIGNDIVLLEPGEYVGPCDIFAEPADVVGEQTTVSSFDPLDPAVFVGSSADYVLRATGESLMLLEVAFRDLPPGVDAVRVGALDALWIKRSWFEGGERAIVQEGPVQELRVTESSFRTFALPMALGCLGACPISSLEISDNLAVGATEALSITGPATGHLTDNVVIAAEAGLRMETQGGQLTLAGNLVQAHGAAMALGAGPVRVEASVLLGEPALRCLDPAARELDILGNTLVGSLDLSGWGPGRGLRFAGNAVLGDLPALDEALAEGNVACDASCFTDAPSWDFYPAPGSPLRGAGAAGLGKDWCGRPRATPSSAGALEALGDRSFGPLLPDFKEQTDCTLPEETSETAPTDGLDTGGETAPSGGGPPKAPSAPECGCAVSRGEGLGALAALAVLSRRPRRDTSGRSERRGGWLW